MIPIDQIREKILKSRGKIFSVSFRRRTDKKDNSGFVVERAGTIRRMTCRTLVSRFVSGLNDPNKRIKEDLANNVVTVFDVQTYNELMKEYKKAGWSKKIAGHLAGPKSYRRVNLEEVIETSLK